MKEALLKMKLSDKTVWKNKEKREQLIEDLRFFIDRIRLLKVQILKDGGLSKKEKRKVVGEWKNVEKGMWRSIMFLEEFDREKLEADIEETLRKVADCIAKAKKEYKLKPEKLKRGLAKLRVSDELRECFNKLPVLSCKPNQEEITEALNNFRGF